MARVTQEFFRYAQSSKSFQDGRAMPMAVHCGGHRLRRYSRHLRNIHKIFFVVVQNLLNFPLRFGAGASIGLKSTHNKTSACFSLQGGALIKPSRAGKADLSRAFSTARKFISTLLVCYVNRKCGCKFDFFRVQAKPKITTRYKKSTVVALVVSSADERYNLGSDPTATYGSNQLSQRRRSCHSPGNFGSSRV